MRNLRNLKHARLKFSASGLPLTATAWDPDNDGHICAFGPTESSAVIELKRFDKEAHSPEDAISIASWDAPCPLPDLACDKILSLRYFAETRSACLILAGGDLVVVREESQAGEDLIEIVGSVDAGITAATWSPDDELVAISTRADTFLLMTRQFESTADAQMSPEDVKVSAHVSVGWGKKETQFHGKRAKALRDPTVPETIDEGVLSPHEDARTTISWRGDGEFVAVNTVEEDKRRMIRVYSREGVLDSVSEPVDGLESALSWRPSGNLIAGVQHRKDRVDVVFFERNGLRHGEFALRLGTESRPGWAENISLAWNNDSTVLAVSFKDRIQLWTTGNYHYYLKQEISLEPASAAAQVTWHPEKPLLLAANTSHNLAGLEYHFEVSSGSVLAPNDIGLVSVVDGTNLKITPLRIANVPPPMAYLEVALPANVIDVCANADGTLLAILHTDSISLYRLTSSGEEPLLARLERKIELSEIFSPCSVSRQIAMDKVDNIYILSSVENNSIDEIITVDTKGQKLDRTPFNDRVVSVTSRLDYEAVVYQTLQGSSSAPGIGYLSAPSEQTSNPTELRLPAVCPRIESWHQGETHLMFGLTAGGTLYAFGKTAEDLEFSQRLQIRGVSSFVITTSHLIFTTTQHLVKFVHLSAGELEVPADEPEKDERCRSIERGARLITVMPSAYSVVLQMPRGNLETIFPRALVLAGIRKAIMAKNYRKAFFACRNHRVDMNILHDYAPEQFLASVALFTEQLKQPVHIDLFLSQLREEDVTETLYKETLVGPKPITNGPASTEDQGAPPTSLQALSSAPSKVNRICDAFLQTLSKLHETNLQNVVTAHVCKTPPDLEAGLQLIAQLRQSDPRRVDQAVEHICFLADVNRLYDAALGLYDLDVALLVAQQSQKDPREYLPYLQSLESLPDLRRKFTIDNDLKRHQKALRHLHSLNVFDELKTYTIKHDLYTDSMDLYRYNPDHLNAIARLYAELLMERNRFKDAGVTYEYLSDYTTASESYLAAQMWRECLSTASLSGRSKNDLQSLATNLAEGLIESKDFSAAAQIYRDYLDDTENAARSWCKAYRFDEAVRVVSLAGQKEMLKSVVDVGLGEGFASMSEMLAEMKTQLLNQVPRLRELRVKKREDPLAFFDGVSSGNNPDIPDDISLAPSSVTTSAGTFMTRYTNQTSSTLATNTTRRSSKNRRREERKRARGKKGSVYEEEYLVASIGRLVERLNSSGEEVRCLVEGLCRRGMRERGSAVQGLIVEVQEMAKAVIGEVFETEKVLVESHGQVGQEVKKEVPVVKGFEKLSLLG